MNNAILKFVLLFMPVAQVILPPPAPAIQAPAIPQTLGANTMPSIFVPGEFQLGPGDVVEATVWTGAENLTSSLTVAADGTMLIPFYVNRLFHVSGLTQLQLRDLIEGEMRKNFRNPTVQVIQKTIESKKVVLASQSHAGTYPITGDTTLLELVLNNGGFASDANIAQVRINRRLTGEQLEVNLLSVLLGLDKQADIKLEPGDIIFIPSVQALGTKIFILTEGKSMTLLQTPEKLNLLEALARSGGAGAAGGVASGVSLARVVVIRANPKGGPTIVKDVNFAQLYKKGDLSLNIPLENGDIIFIPKNILAHVNDIITAINPFTALITQGVLFTTIFGTGGF